MSKKETVEWLKSENDDLKRRLTEARNNSFRALERCDEQQRELNLRAELTGPGWHQPMHCSDGRVWARSADDAREETIRWFAGHALTRATSTAEAVGAAYTLWELLEDHFADERAERKAAETADEPGTDGDDNA